MRLKQLAQVDFRRGKWKDKAEGDDSRASSALTTELLPRPSFSKTAEIPFSKRLRLFVVQIMIDH